MVARWQGDVAARLSRVEAAAHKVFGESRASEAWLHESNGALGNRSPLSLLDTDEGSRLVEAVLGRIAHGIVE